MLKQRLITGGLAALVLILAVRYLPPLPFIMLVSAIMAFGIWEWSGLLSFERFIPKMSYTLGVLCFVPLINLAMSLLSVSPVMHFQYEALLMYVFLLLALLLWVWCAAGVIQYQRGYKPLGLEQSVLRAVLGVVVIIAAWFSVLLSMALLHKGQGLLMGLLLVIVMDTGAYAFGRLFGRHAFIPKVSPNKTWEGFIGGLMMTILTGGILGILMHFTGWLLIKMMLLSAIVAVFSVFGDLTISLFKRLCQLKDTGNILPGHGGLLDRLDSIMPGMVVFCLGWVFLIG